MLRVRHGEGMRHQVDFKEFPGRAGTTTVTDIRGAAHDVADVDIILTKSMFKGYGWLTDDGKSWADYWDAFRRYRHALYITGFGKEKPTVTTELNYQFFNTLTLDDCGFRPEHSYPWLTKKPSLPIFSSAPTRSIA